MGHAPCNPAPGVPTPKGRFQLGAHFLVLLVLPLVATMAVAAIVLQNPGSFGNVLPGRVAARKPAVQDGDSYSEEEPESRHVEPTRRSERALESKRLHGDTHADRGTLGAPFEGCVFILSPVSFEGWTPAYRAAFVQWYADFLIRSLGWQTDLRFQVLLLPGYTPSEVDLVARRLRPENLVVFNPKP